VSAPGKGAARQRENGAASPGGVKGGMSRTLPNRSLGLAVVLLALLTSRAATGEPPGVVDRVELWLELPAHERFVATRSSPGAALAPFITDGCSGGLSAGWAFAARHIPALAEHHGEHPPWEACCVEHDRVYHQGPGEDATASFMARRKADETMRACILAEGAARRDSLMRDYGLSAGMVDVLYEGIAGAMYRAVRLGGAPCSRLSWRWGYGWPQCR
jgi:hypothetical protein